MSTMVEVTRTEYHTFVENMVAAFGEDNVRDAGTRYARDVPTLTVYVKDIAAAAMHFDSTGGNGALEFFDTYYVIGSSFLSWRDVSDESEPWKPTHRDTVTPFATTEDDMKKAPKPRILPMKCVDTLPFYHLLQKAEALLGKKLEEVYSEGELPSSCYVYQGQMVGQMFYGGTAKTVCLCSSVLTMIQYMPHLALLPKE